MTTTTLTDRYVDATLRRLPARQRPDIEQELRASIADAIDDRLQAGGDQKEAETVVLTALGDPARLAAGYADRPLHLIGPALFLDYTRVLGTLLATVVPIVAVVIGLVDAAQGRTALSLIGSAIGAGITTAVHIAVWTTLFFAFLERVPDRRWNPARPWTLDALPRPPSRRLRFTELVAQTVGSVLLTTVILLSPVVSPKADAAGHPIPVLSPWLWHSGIGYVFIALVLATLGFSFARYYARWSLPLTVSSLVVEISPAALLIWLAAHDRVANPAFIDAVGWPDSATKWIGPGLIAIGVLSIVSAVAETLRRARSR
jgi:hypothetical protein